MIERFTDRLQTRFAERLLRQAKREFGHPHPKMTARLVFGWLFSLMVLATPILLIVAGLALMTWNGFEVFPVILGLILIGFGYALLPPRHRNTQATYRRDDVPALFDLMDDISEKLGTDTPDGVHSNEEFNAYMTQYRRPLRQQTEWVVGIGLTLWAASSPAERVAHLAHEIAHKVNNDPLRSGVFFNVRTVLMNWHDTFYLDEDGYDSIGVYHGYSAPIFRTPATSLVNFLLRILTWVSFFESQRAEYRADAFASRVSGAKANITLLEMITRHDLGRRAIIDLYPYTKHQNGRIFDHMGAAVSGADPETKDRFLAEAAQEKRCVDASHPPTSMRIEFLRSLPASVDQDAINMAEIDFGPIDAEIQPIKDALGKEYMQDLYDSEVNR